MTIYTHAIRTATMADVNDPNQPLNFDHVPFTNKELYGAKVVRCHHHNKDERYLVVGETSHYLDVRKLRKDGEIDKRYGSTMVYKIHVVEIYEFFEDSPIVDGVIVPRRDERVTLEDVFEVYEQFIAKGYIVGAVVNHNVGYSDMVHWMKDVGHGIQMNYNENQTITFDRDEVYNLEIGKPSKHGEYNYIRMNIHSKRSADFM